MSRTLHLKPQIEALCAAAGLDMNAVREIVIRPRSITLTVYAAPDVIEEMGAREMETIVTFPWSLDDGPAES